MVDELLARADRMCLAQRLFRAGELPKRVTHCDTKVNNILFDEQDRPLCVIDLDTTMPGFVLSDFGDFIRTAANTGAEDDPDLDKVDVDMDIFRAFAKGYVESTASFLTPVERENLPYGAQLLTYMQTVRFLADYLDGDNYYKIKHPEHNWQRSKAQFKLLQSIEAQEKAMNDYIAGL
jgi:Ser/Thr protein kinase RdoA (MazF antagonist)